MDNSPLSETQLAVMAAAISGDSGGLYSIVARMLDEGIPFESVLFDVLLPTEQNVGRRWQDGDYLVAEEHAATATLETVVALLAGSFERPRDGRRIVVATAQGDHHSLAGRAVAAHLLFLGHPTTFLGANIVAAELREYLLNEDAEVLVLSCAMTNHLVGVREAIRESHSVGVPVVVGGRAFGRDESRARTIGADAWVGDPRGVADVLETWEPDVSASEATALNVTEDLSKLIDSRAQVTALAESGFNGNAMPKARLRDELATLLGVVESAVLIDDSSLIQETLAWQRETLAAQGLRGADSIAAALESALSETSQVGRDLLAAARSAS